MFFKHIFVLVLAKPVAQGQYKCKEGKMTSVSVNTRYYYQVINTYWDVRIRNELNK